MRFSRRLHSNINLSPLPYTATYIHAYHTALRARSLMISETNFHLICAGTRTRAWVVIIFALNWRCCRINGGLLGDD